jgi:hypothetical protein
MASAPKRANLGHGVGQAALDVFDVGGARVDRRAGEALEQHGGAIEVIEVRMRDENGLEAPALRRDPIGELFCIGDPELGIDEDGLLVAVDEGRRHAETRAVRGVDVERERRGFCAGQDAAEGAQDRKRGDGDSPENRECEHGAPVRHASTSPDRAFDSM